MDADEVRLKGEARGEWSTSRRAGAPADLVKVRRARPLLGTFVEIAVDEICETESAETARIGIRYRCGVRGHCDSA